MSLKRLCNLPFKRPEDLSFFPCTSHLPSVSSSALPISDPTCPLMTPKLLSPQLQPLSRVSGTCIRLTYQKMHVSKWCLLPNYFPPVVSTSGKLVPPTPSASSQTNTWLSSFLRPFPLLVGSPISKV